MTMASQVSQVARGIARPLVSVLVSLLLFAIVLLVGQYNVLDVYSSLLVGAVGSPSAIGSTLRWATSLILAGLAVTIPLQGRAIQRRCRGAAATWQASSRHLSASTSIFRPLSCSRWCCSPP